MKFEAPDDHFGSDAGAYQSYNPQKTEAKPQPKQKKVLPRVQDTRPRQIYFDPPADTDIRLTEIQSAENPFLEASGPLLRALADMPEDLNDAGVKGLRGILEEEVSSFTNLCDKANLRREHMLCVRYALCTALDEAASLQKWGGGEGISTGPWSKQALLIKFHQESEGGNTVFELLGRLAANPQEHLNVLEVMLHILDLGFEGKYHANPEGRREIDTVRERLFAIVSSQRATKTMPLSPHGENTTPGKFKLLRFVPVWLTATLVGLAVCGLFAWYKYQLIHERQALEARIRDIGKQTLASTSRLRLKQLLAAEIAKGWVSVQENDDQSKVTFRGDDMFAPAQAEVNTKILPMMDRVAEGINEVNGNVEVVGHSDNQPIATLQFPDNNALSMARAQAVAKLLNERKVAPDRMSSVGLGANQPLVDNTNPAGRAQNRRVEIVVHAQ